MFRIALTLCAAVALMGSTAQAGGGNPSLCRSWESAQSGSGQSFSTRVECAKAKEVFAPSLVASASSVGANETFLLTGNGFHAGVSATLAFSAYGQPPYFSVEGTTNSDGSFLAIVTFTGCGVVTTVVTLTVTDASGVHAATSVTLC